VTAQSPRPSSSHALAEALALLRHGEWQRAHAIVQGVDGPLAAWLHGIVHTLEGDLDNAQYWYRRADRPFPGAGAVAQEIAAAAEALPAGAEPANG
jgi:hypothetical protein